MKKAILATKVGMTQIFNEEDGVLIPVTVLQAGPCVVTQVKTVENDGYSAVQVGYVDKKEKIVTKDNSGKKSIAHRNGVTKAEKGHFDKAGVSGKRYVKEFRFENAEEYTLAQEIKADIFAAGDKIDATAISKGKGFQGAIKRHGQSRGPMTHGSKFHRKPVFSRLNLRSDVENTIFHKDLPDSAVPVQLRQSYIKSSKKCVEDRICGQLSARYHPVLSKAGYRVPVVR